MTDRHDQEIDLTPLLLAAIEESCYRAFDPSKQGRERYQTFVDDTLSLCADAPDDDERRAARDALLKAMSPAQPGGELHPIWTDPAFIAPGVAGLAAVYDALLVTDAAPGRIHVRSSPSRLSLYGMRLDRIWTSADLLEGENWGMRTAQLTLVAAAAQFLQCSSRRRAGIHRAAPNAPTPPTRQREAMGGGSNCG